MSAPWTPTAASHFRVHSGEPSSRRPCSLPAALAVTIVLLALGCPNAFAQYPNDSMGPGLNDASLLGPGGTLQIKPIFFSTNRKIDFDALARAKASGGMFIGS